MTTQYPQADIDLAFLHTCLKKAGELALNQRGKVKASIKSDLTPVTAVDRQVEDFLAGQIAARFPGHSILSEESGVVASGDGFTWVIDPIDGTRAYASGLPIWGVSIGILRGNEPYVGGFYLPVTGETYWGTCKEAFYNDQPLMPPPTNPEELLVFLAVPSNFHLYFEIAYPRVRSLGSTAAHLAYTATGAAIGSLLRAFSLWDLAGLLPMLAALHISLENLSGSPFQASDLLDGGKAREPILAAPPQIIDQLRSAIHATSHRPGTPVQPA